MKYVFLLFISSLFTLPATAQLAISVSTTNPPNGTFFGEKCMHIEQAPSGTMFVYSTFSATSDNFDGLTTGTTGKNRFLAAYNSAGQIQWVRGVSNEPDSKAWMTYGSTGHLYFGSYVSSGTVMIGTQQVVVPPSSSYAVIGQYDTLGNFIRTFSLGQVGTTTAIFDLETNANGDLYALIGTNATGDYNGITIAPNSALPFSILYAVYNPAGQLLSLHPVGRMAGSLFGIFSLDFTPNQEVIIGGFAVSELAQFNGIDIQKGASSISRWQADGTNVWVKALPSGNPLTDCRVYNVCSTPDGNIGFAGNYTGQLTEGFPRDFGNRDVLIGKMSGDGHILWSRNGDDNANAGTTAFGLTSDAESNLYINGVCRGGLIFDLNAICGLNGPYQVAFIARFNSDGTFGWGSCEGYGEGHDLLVQNDQTVYSVGNTADGVVASSSTFLNHWRNPVLTLQPLKTQYCLEETMVLNWSVSGFSFPAGTSAGLEVFKGNTQLYEVGLPNVSGTSGTLTHVLNDFYFMDAPVDSITVILKIGGFNARRSAPFLVAPTPIAVLADETPVCLGGSGWLHATYQNYPPGQVSWTPSAGLLHADSLSAQVLNVLLPSTTYLVTLTDTTYQCSSTDSTHVVPYDFAVHIGGPTDVIQAGNKTYTALKDGGTPYYPIQDQWFKNGVPAVINYQFQTFIGDTTLLNVVSTDNAGCVRTDTLLVYYYPPRLIRGRVIDHDSLNFLPFIPVELWQVSNQQLNPQPQLTVTNANGEFNFTTPGNDSLLIRAVPDTLLYPQEAPAWYTRKYFVQNATPVWLLADTTTLAPIRLFNPQMLPDSNGVLGGHLETTLLATPPLENLFALPGPLAGLPIWLADATGQPLRYTVTDQNGAFHFDKLPLGTFYFLLDKWGINNDLAPSVSLTAQSPQRIHIVGQVLTDRLVLSNIVSTAVTDSPASLHISPNPSNGLFIFHASRQAGLLEVFTSTGLLLSRQSIGALTEQQLDLRAQPAGLYWLRWLDKDGWQVAKLLKY